MTKAWTSDALAAACAGDGEFKIAARFWTGGLRLEIGDDVVAITVTDGAHKAGEATGDGPVDATFKAIQSLFPHTATLALFSVGAVTEGTDAQARTTVRLEEDGKMVDGQGADTDTIVASARAYVHALNKLLVKRARTQPEALSA